MSLANARREIEMKKAVVDKLAKEIGVEETADVEDVVMEDADPPTEGGGHPPVPDTSNDDRNRQLLRKDTEEIHAPELPRNDMMIDLTGSVPPTQGPVALQASQRPDDARVPPGELSGESSAESSGESSGESSESLSENVEVDSSDDSSEEGTGVPAVLAQAPIVRPTNLGVYTVRRYSRHMTYRHSADDWLVDMVRLGCRGRH